MTLCVIAAIVTFTVAPCASAAFMQQGEKLTATEQISRGAFGNAVAISADGNTALIGAEGDNEYVGAVWVFTRSGSTWTAQAKLTGRGESGKAAFGKSVALSADGNTALIGGSEDSHGRGAAWAFTRSGSNWTQQANKLAPAGWPSRKSSFGSSVALSEDGTTALIGGSSYRSRGAAWVFTRSGSIWAQQGAKLTASDEKGKGELGDSVALSADGNTALIGGRSDRHLRGAAWVFTRAGGTWSQQGGKLTGTCEADRESSNFRGAFGWSVALSADGNTALIGQPYCGFFNCAGPHCAFRANAYVFARSGSAWTRQQEILGESEPEGNGGFGDSVALSPSGNAALIASRGSCFEFCGAGSYPGAAWTFARSGETWTQQGAKLTGSGEVKPEYGSVEFGASVALASDAKTALIGGPGDNGGLGAAWVFVQ